MIPVEIITKTWKCILCEKEYKDRFLAKECCCTNGGTEIIKFEDKQQVKEAIDTLEKELLAAKDGIDSRKAFDKLKNELMKTLEKPWITIIRKVNTLHIKKKKRYSKFMSVDKDKKYPSKLQKDNEIVEKWHKQSEPDVVDEIERDLNKDMYGINWYNALKKETHEEKVAEQHIREVEEGKVRVKPGDDLASKPSNPNMTVSDGPTTPEPEDD